MLLTLYSLVAGPVAAGPAAGHRSLARGIVRPQPSGRGGGAVWDPDPGYGGDPGAWFGRLNVETAPDAEGTRETETEASLVRPAAPAPSLAPSPPSSPPQAVSFRGAFPSAPSLGHDMAPSARTAPVAPPPEPRAPGQGPRIYALHREYGLTPDAAPPSPPR